MLSNSGLGCGKKSMTWTFSHRNKHTDHFNLTLSIHFVFAAYRIVLRYFWIRPQAILGIVLPIYFTVFMGKNLRFLGLFQLGFCML